ncbi:MAG: hypothetical protein MUF38_01470 [Anaerolineae bacterium]|jgi:hypothetical protein|nr:hypothetical protein [Anaerolineae bacterium]
MLLRLLDFLAQVVPPTPTYIPPNTTPIPLELPSPKIWDYAPQAVGMWNMFRDLTPAFQIMLLLLLIFVGIQFIIRLIREVQSND